MTFPKEFESENLLEVCQISRYPMDLCNKEQNRNRKTDIFCWRNVGFQVTRSWFQKNWKQPMDKHGDDKTNFQFCDSKNNRMFLFLKSVADNEQNYVFKLDLQSEFIKR